MKSELLPCLLMFCPEIFIHLVHFCFLNPLYMLTFKKLSFSSLKEPSFHDVLILHSFSTPTVSLETHVPYVSLTCIIAILGITSDTEPWRAWRAGLEAHLSQIYSLTQEFKHKPTLLNVKFPGEKNP